MLKVLQASRGFAPAAEALALLAVTLPLAVSLGYPALWFVMPFALITLLDRPYEEYGLTRGEPGGVRFHAAVVITVLGAYALGHFAVYRWILGATFDPRLPPRAAELLLEQVLVIGLCEEFFFRGYLQTQLNRWFGRPYRFLGAHWGLGLILASVLFGVCHLATGDWTRLRVSFFGLFAGWLRERTGTVLVPAVYHGLSNMLYYTLAHSLTLQQ